MFIFTQRQIERFQLPLSIKDQGGAAVFGRFVEGYIDYDKREFTDDTVHFEIGGEKIVVIFDERFLGLRADLVALPGEKWPPDAINRVTHRIKAKVPLWTTTAQVLAG